MASNPVSSLGLVALAALCVPAWSQTTTHVSVTSAGAQAAGDSGYATISNDGRTVAFASIAPNLVPNDTNGQFDIFVRDLWSWTTERIDVNPTGGQTAGAWDMPPALSADGRFVVFTSGAADLVAGDTNGFADVFVRDRATHVTTRVNVSSLGAQANDITFEQTSISADGRYVAFKSYATNLVAGDTNGCGDIFVHDRQTGVTERVSVDSTGVQADSYSDSAMISPDGRYVAFSSAATNLVVGDTNAVDDVFVHDRVSGTTERISVDALGVEGNGYSTGPTWSGDGRYIVYTSGATNLVAGDTNGHFDVLVFDRQLGLTERVSVDSSGVEGNHDSGGGGISSDGRFVVFSGSATNLVAGDTNAVTDVFVRDRANGTTERVNVSNVAAQANRFSASPSISSDGRRVVFLSGATNLVAGDSNGFNDVFLRDRWGSTPQTYCTAKPNSAGCTPAIVWSGAPSISAGGGFVIAAEQVLELEMGLLFYGVHGPNASAFQGGLMCVHAPLVRTVVQTSNSAGAPPCVGTYSFDFNAHIASGGDLALALGRQVWAQYWTRDPLLPSNTGLTDALTFVIGP